MIEIRDNDENAKKQEEKKDEDKKTKEVIEKADKDDLELIARIGNLYQVINKPGYLDINRLRNAVNDLSEFNKIQEYDYLHNLLVPERCKGVKIPSPIPVPSCAFQMHNSVTLSTNSTGNMCAMFNPVFLSNSNLSQINIPAGTYIDSNGQQMAYGAANLQPQFLTTLWVNNADDLDGNSPNDNFVPYNIGQCIPPVYDQYRLVSASLVVRYIGRLDNASGLMCGAIVFDESRYIGGDLLDTATSSNVPFSTVNPDLAKYGNFELARDSFYHQENMAIEGLRMLYFPVDNSFEEYAKTFDTSLGDFSLNASPAGVYANTTLSCQQDYYKSGFNFFFYSINAPPNTACFKVDIYCNYECLPNASFLNYLPLSMNAKGISSKEKQKANMIVQQKPVMKANEGVEKVSTSVMPSIWNKMIDKFSGQLPNIASMFGKGILTALSGFKTGIAISNALGSFMGSGGAGALGGLASMALEI